MNVSLSSHVGDAAFDQLREEKEFAEGQVLHRKF